MTQSVSMAKIARLEVISLASPEPPPTDLDGTTDTLIVKIFDENGRFGIGETDAPPDVARHFLEMPTDDQRTRRHRAAEYRPCRGFTEIRRIAELCEYYGAEVVPHGWKTGITSADCRKT